MGSLPPQSSGLKYVVQAVNGIGLVSLDDNLGAYYSVAAFSVAGGTNAPVATTLSFVSPPSGAVYGGTATVTATLGKSGGPVAGKPVTVSVGTSSQTGTTDGGGNVTVTLPSRRCPTRICLKASFSGDQEHLASSVSSDGFVVGKATSNLDTPVPLGARLTGNFAGSQQPIDGAVSSSSRARAARSTSGRSRITSASRCCRRRVSPRATTPSPSVVRRQCGLISAARGPLSQPITIEKAGQTIGFDPLAGARPSAAADFTVSATTTSLLPVSFGRERPMHGDGQHRSHHRSGVLRNHRIASRQSRLQCRPSESRGASRLRRSGSTTALSASPRRSCWASPSR
jgi:hypothetical protein